MNPSSKQDAGAPALARLRGTSLLVVGGAGFVGSNLVRMALEAGCARVVIVDNFLSSERSLVLRDKRVSLIKGSIADDAVLRKLTDAVDYVFHLATYHGNQSSIADPIADHDNNLITTLKLYERLKNFPRVKKIVYAASGCTLAPHTFEQAQATQEDGPVPFDLDSPYQISKVVGEFYSVYYWRQHKLPTVRARFQNVYGPGEVLGAGRWRGTPATVWRNVTPTFIYRAVKQRSLTVENEGRASRDFIFVEDIVRGLVLCALEGQPGDVYNLASGKETTIAELATAVNRITGNPAPVEFLPKRDWDHSGRRFGSTDKAKRVLGFESHVGLDEGLQRTVEWTRRNLTLIESAIRKHVARLRQHEGPSTARKGSR